MNLVDSVAPRFGLDSAVRALGSRGLLGERNRLMVGEEKIVGVEWRKSSWSGSDGGCVSVTLAYLPAAVADDDGGDAA